jgi:adenine-specific DNA-methyltransferase
MGFSRASQHSGSPFGQVAFAFDRPASPDSARTGTPVDQSLSRFANVEERKATGATYTPKELASYVAERLVSSARHLLSRPQLRILDPALGDGALVAALLAVLEYQTSATLSVLAYETDHDVAARARRELRKRFPRATIDVVAQDFLRRANSVANEVDMIIANPPYVRTQIMGADDARVLAARFGLEGRVDLYQAFLLALIAALRTDGAMAAIVSNRFMTTVGAGALRATLRSRLQIHRVWDLGDTKLFDAAVLPAVCGTISIA